MRPVKNCKGLYPGIAIRSWCVS